MVSVSSIGASSSIRASKPAVEPVSVSDFIRSSALKADYALRIALLDIFEAKPSLTVDFDRAFSTAMQDAAARGLPITRENAAHNALVETILKNRDAFPAQGFTIKTEFPGGGSIETPIAAVSSSSPGGITSAAASTASSRFAALLSGTAS